MKDALVRLISSAKFWTAVIALIAVFAARYGFQISEQMTALVGAIFAVLLGAQGATDHGKEAAKLNAEAAVVNASSAAATATPPVQVAAGDIVNEPTILKEPPK